MEEYGRFAEAFRRIGIKASTRSVVGEFYKRTILSTFTDIKRFL